MLKKPNTEQEIKITKPVKYQETSWEHVKKNQYKTKNKENKTGE